MNKENKIKELLGEIIKMMEEMEEMEEKNRNSIDKIPEKTERDKMTNLLNENMIFGYQQALQDIIAKLKND